HKHPDFKQPANPTACPSSAWKVAGDNLYTRIMQDNWHGYPDPQPPQTSPVPPTPPPDPEPEPVPPPDDCKDAVNTAIAETDAKWQSQVETANNNLEKCQESLKKAKKELVKDIGLFEYLSLKLRR
ncbi:MAG: hypothetical protein KAJ75_09255, partial [Alphaproteobacteria bacterium]|nr:hypothetical protein [Alphaproteobacteria bacterium]